MNAHDPGVLLVAEVHGLAGRVNELRALLAELGEATRGEPKSTGFRVLASDEPGELVLLISWTDEPGLREHYATPHYLGYRGRVGPLLARPSDVVVHHISATLHARDPNPPDPGMFG
ncbi:MAG: antibiotic biosynthesis monooxygenase [Actinomycetota bacterium]|nr:antibiotic biosynthesis monooxygenase [Actinomycetota bacterium]